LRISHQSTSIIILTTVLYTEQLLRRSTRQLDAEILPMSMGRKAITNYKTLL
jgi:hypothetical protein